MEALDGFGEEAGHCCWGLWGGVVGKAVEILRLVCRIAAVLFIVSGSPIPKDRFFEHRKSKPGGQISDFQEKDFRTRTKATPKRVRNHRLQQRIPVLLLSFLFSLDFALALTKTGGYLVSKLSLSPLVLFLPFSKAKYSNLGYLVI